MTSSHLALTACADGLQTALSRATPSNCVAVARALIRLAKEHELPPPTTHQIEPLDLDGRPYSRTERQALRLVLPLRPEVKERLGLAPDELLRFPSWPYHITTEFVVDILVDYLTGERGAPSDTYLETFFNHSEYLRLAQFDVLQEDEPV